jgi:hypothetical protein
MSPSLHFGQLPLALTVQRIETENGAYIEPACDDSWTDFMKLRWLAGIVEMDTNLLVRIEQANEEQRYEGGYQVHVAHRDHVKTDRDVSGPHTFDHAWRYLNGISTGFEFAMMEKEAANG